MATIRAQEGRRRTENDEHKERLRTRRTAPRRNPWDRARRNDEKRKREMKVAEGAEEEEEEVGTPREIKGARRS